MIHFDVNNDEGLQLFAFYDHNLFMWKLATDRAYRRPW